MDVLIEALSTRSDDFIKVPHRHPDITTRINNASLSNYICYHTSNQMAVIHTKNINDLYRWNIQGHYNEPVKKELSS